MRTSLGTGRSDQVGRGRKAHQIQGREGREAKGGACSQSRERAIARRGRGGGTPKESPSKGRLEKSRQCAVQTRGFAATGIDNALDLIDVVTAKMDKASVGNQAAATVEKHPEVRVFIIPELTVVSDVPTLALQRRFKVLLFLSVSSYKLFTSPQGRIQRLRGSGTA